MILSKEDAALTACCKGSEFTTRANGTCLATSCMAWRWAQALTPSGQKTDAPSKTHGYCGLAGKP